MKTTLKYSVTILCRPTQSGLVFFADDSLSFTFVITFPLSIKIDVTPRSTPPPPPLKTKINKKRIY